ncbi:MAG: BioY protein [Paenibacillaceae bacterium]|jgi:biotin transport system substrate-specific component|nr:BioY protein [Paenibacillaceae bacterium]
MVFRPTTRGIVFMAAFSALFALSSYMNIHLGFSPVPISLENFTVMLAGAILGPVYGFGSIALVLGLAVLGLPIMDGRGGLALLTGPTGGFIWMFPFAALLIGLVSRCVRGNRKFSLAVMFLAMTLFGSLLLYVTGIPWLAHAANLSFPKAMSMGCYPYLPGDAVKAALAAVVAVTVRQVFPIQRITGAGRYNGKETIETV